MNTLQNSFSVKVQIHKMPRLKLYTSTDTPEYCSRVHHSKQEYVKISKKKLAHGLTTFSRSEAGLEINDLNRSSTE